LANAPDAKVDAASKEALRYGKALYSGFQSLSTRPLTKQTAIEVCSTIKCVDMEIRRVPGTTLMEAVSGKVIYTPPSGEQILPESSHKAPYLKVGDIRRAS
jgi:hypothetical protein